MGLMKEKRRRLAKRSIIISFNLVKKRCRPQNSVETSHFSKRKDHQAAGADKIKERKKNAPTQNDDG